MLRDSRDCDLISMVLHETAVWFSAHNQGFDVYDSDTIIFSVILSINKPSGRDLYNLETFITFITLSYIAVNSTHCLSSTVLKLNRMISS